MQKRTVLASVFAGGLMLAAFSGFTACTTKNTASPVDASVGDGAASGDATSPDAAGPSGDASSVSCGKFGNFGNLQAAMTNLVQGLLLDCRIAPFFASLDQLAQGHMRDCLSNQLGELMHCAGVTYNGSHDSDGGLCRDMTTAHLGLGISDADFNAMMSDITEVLGQAGISAADIAQIAPALLSLKPQIEASDAGTLTENTCEGGAEGGIPPMPDM